MVGITQNRSIQDEKLIESIFQTHISPESRATSTVVYGAQTTNLIIDARPTANAMANTAKGAGTENMDHYKDAKKVYLGIDHIHAMRESLAKVVEALRDADSLLASINSDISGQLTGVSVLDRQALRRSGWLRHISAILEGVNLITRNVHVNSSHVLIHCSDGWDRTSQLSSIAQLCLDPFYRTIRGFEILIEKDWLSYGYKFLDRCGHLSSDKFFVSPSETTNGGSGAEAAQAFFASVQNRFTGQNHIKETSPVFHQFLESVRQIQRQFPERFEFNERFLHQLYYHLYSCQFGTFLFNCEKERRVGDGSNPPITERTVSIWDFLNSSAEMEQNLNPLYDASLDDPANRNTTKADMGVLFPNSKDVRFWHELYGRTDEEMNGRSVPLIRSSDLVGPVENTEDDTAIRADTPSAIPLPPSPTKSPLVPPGSLPQSPSTPDLGTDLSASMPESTVPPRVSSPTESFRPYRKTSSSFSMKPSSSTSLPSSPSGRPLGKAQDFFSGGGVRSVWGKLSSNASAALSVVQEAYDGVTKDFGRTSPGPGSERTEELRGREALSDWGSAREPPVVEPSSLRSTTGSEPRTPITSNPWATATSPEPVTSFYDNPWNTVHSSAPSRQTQLTDPLLWTLGTSQSDSSLPADPTISHPSLIRKASSNQRTADPTPLSPPANPAHSSIKEDRDTQSDMRDIDPLGVGF
ncbi:hypothetical protein D9758_000738 [Tetrapyrgos nigripes]|uniref:Myotubularin phosphatase domain-containing protein n=1 Tax=Tetrapyrgos nigripes TaxID=182062 RepID=A0A8H5GZ69_9AGAR|nr:hypothetical protein D9758_000738 [Tetrapyrgos nigripes]